jgi:hypothetical protein
VFRSCLTIVSLQSVCLTTYSVRRLSSTPFSLTELAPRIAHQHPAVTSSERRRPRYASAGSQWRSPLGGPAEKKILLRDCYSRRSQFYGAPMFLIQKKAHGYLLAAKLTEAQAYEVLCATKIRWVRGAQEVDLPTYSVADLQMRARKFQSELPSVEPFLTKWQRLRHGYPKKNRS